MVHGAQASLPPPPPRTVAAVRWCATPLLARLVSRLCLGLRASPPPAAPDLGDLPPAPLLPPSPPRFSFVMVGVAGQPLGPRGRLWQQRAAAGPHRGEGAAAAGQRTTRGPPHRHHTGRRASQPHACSSPRAQPAEAAARAPAQPTRRTRATAAGVTDYTACTRHCCANRGQKRFNRRHHHHPRGRASALPPRPPPRP